MLNFNMDYMSSDGLPYSRVDIRRLENGWYVKVHRYENLNTDALRGLFDSLMGSSNGGEANPWDLDGEAWKQATAGADSNIGDVLTKLSEIAGRPAKKLVTQEYVFKTTDDMEDFLHGTFGTLEQDNDA